MLDRIYSGYSQIHVEKFSYLHNFVIKVTKKVMDINKAEKVMKFQIKLFKNANTKIKKLKVSPRS